MDKETWIHIMDFGAYASELDWVAVDNSGQIGIFSTVMHAPIPIEVKKSYELYTELETIIDELPEHASAQKVTTNNGDFSDWLAYSKKGLFAFDFQDAHRTDKEKLDQYDLIFQPSNPLIIGELDLSEAVKTIIPKIKCNFRDGGIEHKKIISMYSEKISKKEFYNIIKDTPVTPNKWDVFAGVNPTFLTKDVFDLLVFQLRDPDNRTRFFGLFHLIDKFRERLSNANDELADLMIQLLSDTDHPVVDRAVWALTIMGDVGLKKLFENVNSDDLKLRWCILATIGKSAHLNVKKSIEVLVEGIQDKNEDIRYIAMVALMDLSPLPKENNDRIKGFDFTAIYQLIKPVAKSFIASKKEMRSNSGTRYLKWIEEEEQKVK